MLKREQIEFILASLDHEKAIVPVKEAKVCFETLEELKDQLSKLPPAKAAPLKVAGGKA